MNYFYIILFPACYLFLNLVEKGKIKGKTYFIFSFVFIISVLRITNKGYQLDFINVISAILLFPVLIKYFSYIRFKGGNEIYILLIEYIISFLVIELFVLFFIKQITPYQILMKDFYLLPIHFGPCLYFFITLVVNLYLCLLSYPPYPQLLTCTS